MDSMMEGCGCTFAATDLDKGNYLFESNFDSVACISVGGRPVILTLDHTDQYRRKIDDKETGDNSFVNFEAEDYNATYTNDQYKLTIKAKITKEAWEESESFGYKGEMKLENKKGKVITRKIVGTCEC